MKVTELEVGMMLKAVGDNQVFHVAVYSGMRDIPYLTVRNKGVFKYSGATPTLTDTPPMYLGRRKDVHVTMADFSWSDRYVMVNGHIAAVDPSSWRYIQPIL